MIVPPGAVWVRGVAQGEIGLDSVIFDAASLTLQVELSQAVMADVVTVVIDQRVISLDGRVSLDGESGDPAEASFPTGNGQPGGQTVFQYFILQGDANRDGAVNKADMQLLQSQLGMSFGDLDFNPDVDLNDDGVVNTQDVAILLGGLGGMLPVTDGARPVVTGVTPQIGVPLNSDLSEVIVNLSEPVDILTLDARAVYAVDSNGVLATANSVLLSGDEQTATFTFEPPLPQCGQYTVGISPSLSDLSGEPMVPYGFSTLSGVVPAQSAIIEPVEHTTAMSTLQISGVAPNASMVEIAGSRQTVTVNTAPDGSFSFDVLLRENQLNRISVTAITACGTRSAPRVVEVIQDQEAPSVFIDFPTAGAQIQADTTDVAGRVSDRLSGFEGLEVLVNGQPAEVDIGVGTNGTFFLQGVPLNVGTSTNIVVIATDELGNTSSTQISVERLVIQPGTPRMDIVSGNGQAGVVHQQLGNPITVQMFRGDGSPFAGKIVTFKVTRSNGRLRPTPGLPGGVMNLQVLTDSQGYASAYWTVGSDAGCGNNRVSVVSQDIAGTIVFCASAAPLPADRILVSDMNNQRAEAGGPLPDPMRVWVTDGCNGVAGMPVTFSVTRGDGMFSNGASQITVNSDSTGHVGVPFILGQTPGRNVVEASFASNPGLPATFISTGIQRDLSMPTRFDGVVLDNAQRALGNAHVYLAVNGVFAAETYTDIEGNFSFEGIPDGSAHVVADGSTANTLAGDPIPLNTFPYIGYNLTIVPNAQNQLSTPILLPEKNTANQFVYDGTQDVTLTVEGVEGVEFTVAAGTIVRLIDGTTINGTNGNSVVLSLDQVHSDSIPMPLPDGAAYPFAWTLQPKAATFDPPIQVALPNMVGLDAGAVAYILQWDGQADEFKITASGQVSADGSTINSDAGSGITVAGWGGACPPYPPQTEIKRCPTPTSNGCSYSPDVWTFIHDSLGNYNYSLVGSRCPPDSECYTLDFKLGGCDAHDYCYGDCSSGPDRLVCDIRLRDNLLNACGTISGISNAGESIVDCRAIAYTYYTVVRGAGFLAFNSARDDCLDCEPKGLPKNPEDEDIRRGIFPPPFLDQDGDGIEDSWEVMNGLDPSFAGDMIADFDGDGLTNVAEFLFGSDPLNAFSVDPMVSDSESFWATQPPPPLVIDDDWSVSTDGVLGDVGPSGAFSIQISSNDQLHRLRGSAIKRGVRLYWATDFFESEDNATVEIANGEFSYTPFPAPSILTIVGESLLVIGDVNQLEITAFLSDGSIANLSLRTQGTTYTSSNPSVASVNDTGLLTAVAPGRAFITVSNQGVTAVKRIDVTASIVNTTVLGFVLLPDGSPAAGAMVTSPFFGGSAISGSDGSFSLALSVASKATGVSIQASLDGYAPITGPSVSIVAEGLTDAGVLRLRTQSTGQLFPGPVFATGLRPISVAIGDLDGDGTRDLTVANRNSNSVSVLLGNGDGTFQPRQDFATGVDPWSVSIGDLDGDGTPDLAVANSSSDTVSVLLNQRNKQRSTTLLAGGEDSWKHTPWPGPIHPKANDAASNAPQTGTSAGRTIAPHEPIESSKAAPSSPRLVRVDATDLRVLSEKQARALLTDAREPGYEDTLSNQLGQRVQALRDSQTGLTSAVLIDFDGTERSIPKLHPTGSDVPVAINERGDVIGVSTQGEGWVWRYATPERVESIGNLGGSGSVTSFWLGLVAVLGQADLPGGDIRAVLWTPGDKLLDLSRLTSEPAISLHTVLGVLPGGVVIAQGIDGNGQSVIVSMTLRLTETMPGDLDGSGIVDGIDVRLAVEMIQDQNLVMDLNQDGTVDYQDLTVVIRNLGRRSALIELE
ncbi:MAG: VCBS repeat-containing protein [Phycisphaerales bacterium]|nr:VCBS repeat-containing protein [Phycisphaerales bacterium]